MKNLCSAVDCRRGLTGKRKFFSRRVLWIAVAMALALTGLYLPSIYYLAYKADIAGKPILENTEIVMGKGWFPIMSSESGLFHLLYGGGGESRIPGIVFIKINGLRPGFVDRMIVFKVAYPNLETTSAKNYLVKRDYPWGVATVLRADFYRKVMNEREEKKDEIVIIERHALAIHLPNSASLNEIIQITEHTGTQRNNDKGSSAQ